MDKFDKMLNKEKTKDEEAELSQKQTKQLIKALFDYVCKETHKKKYIYIRLIEGEDDGRHFFQKPSKMQVSFYTIERSGLFGKMKQKNYGGIIVSLYNRGGKLLIEDRFAVEGSYNDTVMFSSTDKDEFLAYIAREYHNWKVRHNIVDD